MPPSLVSDKKKMSTSSLSTTNRSNSTHSPLKKKSTTIDIDNYMKTVNDNDDRNTIDDIVYNKKNKYTTPYNSISSYSELEANQVDDSTKSTAITGVNRKAKGINRIRRAVSQKRIRFQDHQFDLDLTYITPNIVAMGLPANGVSTLFRNHIDDVAQMQQLYHQDHFMLFNLSQEVYEYRKFFNHVIDLGWKDHYGPPMHIQIKIVIAATYWLAQDPENVVVIHCKAGKGRTGTAISAQMMYCGQFDTPQNSLGYFGYRRLRNITKGGVTIPSQKRVVYQFHRILQGESLLPLKCTLEKIEFIGYPSIKTKKKYDIYIRILYENTTEIYNSKNISLKLSYDNTNTTLNNININLCGDYLIRVYIKGYFSQQNLCRINFCTTFIPDDGIIKLYCREQDGPHKNSDCPNTFCIAQYFKDIEKRIENRSQEYWENIDKYTSVYTKTINCININNEERKKKLKKRQHELEERLLLSSNSDNKKIELEAANILKNEDITLHDEQLRQINSLSTATVLDLEINNKKQDKTFTTNSYIKEYQLNTESQKNINNIEQQWYEQSKPRTQNIIPNISLIPYHLDTESSVQQMIRVAAGDSDISNEDEEDDNDFDDDDYSGSSSYISETNDASLRLSLKAQRNAIDKNTNDEFTNNGHRISISSTSNRVSTLQGPLIIFR